MVLWQADQSFGSARDCGWEYRRRVSCFCDLRRDVVSVQARCFHNFGGDDDEPSAHGDVLIFSGEVSTSADWNGIANYLKKKYKAKAVKWVSEQDTSLTDFLDV